MADNLNIDGNIEVYVGPRGFSVVDAKGDGTNVRFVTDEPRTLNPVPLPRGPKGDRGATGAPGEASIRVDETVGYRVFLWHPATAAEQMVYGDTGVRRLTDGSLVRRVGAQVETTTTNTTTLPPGFRPTIDGNRPMFTTADPWPTALPGTKVTDPAKMTGLEDYAAAVTNGYPGTAEQWLNDKYRVLPDPSKVPQGHVLTRTGTGLAYAPLPQIGPGPWRSLTLDKTWKVTSHLGSRAQTRTNNDRVDFYGHLTYTGPTVEAGMWSWDGVRIGVMAPQDAPLFNIELVVITYEGASGAGRPVPARLHVSDKGVVQLMCFSDNGKEQTLTVKAGVTQVGLTGLSFPARPQ
jgi:hypothetical protein